MCMLNEWCLNRGLISDWNEKFQIKVLNRIILTLECLIFIEIQIHFKLAHTRGGRGVSLSTISFWFFFLVSWFLFYLI